MINQFKNKKVTVMGLGLNAGGLGIARFLAKAGAKVLVTDLKTEKELSLSLKKLEGLSIKYVLGKHNEEDFKNTDLIIKNPAVPNTSHYLKIAKKNKVPIKTDMEIFMQLCPSKNIIGVAGTKGKSTTSSLIYHLFKYAKKDVVLAGNIGISVIDSLFLIKKETIVILEISSWQLEGLKRSRFSPLIAILTNVLPDHLDRYINFNEYSEAEQLIYKYQNKNKILILNKDNKISYNARKKSKSQLFFFSTKNKIKHGCFVENDNIICKINNDKKNIIKIKEIPILGEHNLENVLIACIVTMIYKLPENIIKDGIKTFKNLPHRLEFIKEINNVKFYNDSAATTPDACISAINSFKEHIILILGGKNKKMCFRKLIKEIAQNKKIKKIILLKHKEYDASVNILEEAKKLKIINKFISASNIEDAVKISSELAKKKDIVILSPAAASFGMFINEFDRGKKFINQIKKYDKYNKKNN